MLNGNRKLFIRLVTIFLIILLVAVVTAVVLALGDYVGFLHYLHFNP